MCGGDKMKINPEDLHMMKFPWLNIKQYETKKVKPFDQFELILVEYGTAPETYIEDYNLLYNSGMPHKSYSFDYAYYIDKNLEIVQVLPTDNGLIKVDIFEVKAEIDYRYKFHNYDNEYTHKMIMKLSKRFERERHKLAYKLLKITKGKERGMCCWQWDRTPTLFFGPQSVTLGDPVRVFCNYSMFALVKEG